VAAVDMSHSQEAASMALAGLAKRFWEFQCYEWPLIAIQAGEATSDAVLFREAPCDVERRFGIAGKFLDELHAIPDDELLVQDLATHQLLREQLDEILLFYEVKLHQRPSLYPFGPEFATTYFASAVTIVNLASAELYLERLKTIAIYLRDIRENLSLGYEAGFRYPRQVLASAAESIGASIQSDVEYSSWFSPFRRCIVSSENLEDVEHSAREIISETIIPELQGYAAFLTGPMADGARASVSCMDDFKGEDLYSALIRHFTTTNLTPDELHDIGTAEVQRLVQDMELFAGRAGFSGRLPAYRSYLATDPQFTANSKESLREQMEVIAKRIDLKIPAFFGRTPRVTYGIQSISERASLTLPAAYAQPNPADCSGPGVLWITGLPEKAPSFMHLPLCLHEGWPGHLMHIALIQERKDLPAFRRFGALRYSVCLEGWALHCEGLGVEMGLYETPHQHYGRLEMEMWRALRLVVDTGLHAKRWSRSKAIEYMAAHLAFSRATIESEVDRYIGYPAQALAYHIGLLKFREVRRRAEKRVGSRFDIRGFHDQIMAVGPVSLPVLERLSESW
jgi:uncharacterized protein (DUF885 family)